MDITEKQKILDNLQKQGCNAYFQDGILYFTGIEFSEVERIVVEIGYRGSYGVRQKKEEI